MRDARKITLFLFCLTVGVSGCVGPAPQEDYVLSQTAMKHAQQAGAPKLAPGYWNKAEKFYQKGEIQYKNRDYEEAQSSFKKAQKYAERAENVSRLKQFQTGEGIP